MSILPRSILYKTYLGLTFRNAIVGNFMLPSVGQQRVELDR